MKKLLILLVLINLGVVIGVCQSPPNPPDELTSPLVNLPYDHNYKLASVMFSWDNDNNRWVPVWVSSQGAVVTTMEPISGSTGTVVLVSSYTTTTINARLDRKFFTIHSAPTNSGMARWRMGINANIQTEGDYLDIGELEGYSYTGAIHIRAEVGVSAQTIAIKELW